MGWKVQMVFSLTAKSIEGAALTLEGIDNIHGCDSLPLGMFSVGDSITDDILKEDLEDTSGLLIDEARDTLDTSTASQSADGGLGDTLDVITQYFSVTLGASLAESFASFSSSSHDVFFLIVQLRMMYFKNWILFYTEVVRSIAISVRDYESRDQIFWRKIC